VPVPPQRCAGCLPSKAIFKLLAAAKYLYLDRSPWGI
jgi:hypothetical protein